MTGRDWRSDRRSIFERDDYTCQHCDRSATADELRTHPVGAVPLESHTVHESLLTTVCDDCFELLRGEGVGPEDSRGLFEHVHALTRTQGQAIADTAGFASLATDLPGQLEADERPPYSDRRRSLLLSLDVVDRRLGAIRSVEEAGIADRDSLQAFVATAAQSQREVRRVVELVEALVTGLGLCSVCFSRLSPDEHRCPTCRSERTEDDTWQREDGRTAFDDLYAAINSTLAETSRTTEALTAQATALAEDLLEDG